MIASSPRIMGNMRNIGNLSLDMNYPGLGSPASPSSPSFSSLPSPTFSGSWNQNKSQAELTSLLKEAYNSIKDKERDLMLAAEIGKSLLENNIALKSQYETLAIQAQQLQRERIRATTFTLQAQSADKPNIPAIAPPRDALESSLMDSLPEFDESDSDSNFGWSSGVDFKNSSISQDSKKNKRDQGLSYKDFENIRDLENRNQMLQIKLEETMKEYNESDKTSKIKLRKMDQDLQYYQEAHALATQKIEELEKENNRLLQKTRTEFWNTRLNNKTNDNANNNIVDELLQKLRDLEDQKNTVERAKSEIERRFNRVTQDLEILQEQYNELAEASNGYENLQIVSREQELLINELNESLEEQRAVVASMQSGMYSRQQSRSSSFSEGGIMSKALKRLSNPDSLNLFGSMNTNKRTLLSELESEWFKTLQVDKKPTDPNDVTPLFSPSLSALGDDDLSQIDYLSDDEFSFLDELDYDDEMAMRKREWFWRRWIRSFYNFLRWIWRWCRFLVVLVAAVIMALYRGPDHILPHEV